MNYKLCVMSDSHVFNENVIKVIKDNKDCDYFYHLGDLCSNPSYFGPLISLKGNNDYGYSNMPASLTPCFNGVKILMIHSHQLSYPRKENLALLAKKNNCSLVFYGHSHEVVDEEIEGIRLLNPGSLFYNRDGNEIGYYIVKIDEEKNVEVCRKVL